MVKYKPSCRTDVTCYAPGNETYHRILKAAIELFGKHGFAGTSTRQIAVRSGVTPPALQYHFNNKRGLYNACCDYLAQESIAFLEPVIAHASNLLKGSCEMQVIIDAFILTQEILADCITNFASADHKRFRIREQGAAASFAPNLQTRQLYERLDSAAVHLLTKIIDSEADDPVTLIRVLSLRSQLMVFYLMPSEVQGLLGWNDIDVKQGQLLKDIVREQVKTLLENWSANTLSEHVLTSSKLRRR